MKDSTFLYLRILMIVLLGLTYIFYQNNIILALALFFTLWTVIDLIFSRKKSDEIKPIGKE